MLMLLFSGWNYRYYCPIPGCAHHILNSVDLNCADDESNSIEIESNNAHENDSIKTNGVRITPEKCGGNNKHISKHFPHITALKQHYSKVNCKFSFACHS